MSAADKTKLDSSGSANGLATLDSGGHLTSGQIPTTVVVTSMADAADGYLQLDGSGNVSGVNLITLHDTATNVDALVPLAGQLAYTTDTRELRMGDGTVSGGNCVFTMLNTSASGAVNAANLAATYTALTSAMLGQASTYNRAVIVLPPGLYDLTTLPGNFTLSASYIDLVGFSGRGGEHRESPVRLSDAAAATSS